jgi:hypothetical protein
MQKIYKAITYITYPGFISLLGFFLVSKNLGNNTLPILLSAGLLMGVIPLSFVFIMTKRNHFESIHLKHIQERKKAVLLTIGCLTIFTSLAYFFGNDKSLQVFNTLILLSLIVQYLFNSANIKISIHLLSITAFLMYFFIHSSYLINAINLTSNGILLSQKQWMVFMVLIISLVYLSRLKLKAHSPFELNLGIIIGVSITFINEYIWHVLWN